MHVTITPGPDDTITDEELDGLRGSVHQTVALWMGDRVADVTVETTKPKAARR